MSWPARLGTIAQPSGQKKLYAFGTQFFGDFGNNESGMAFSPRRITVGNASNMRFSSGSLASTLYSYFGPQGCFNCVISKSGAMGFMGIGQQFYQPSCATTNQIVWYDGVTPCIFTGSNWRQVSTGDFFATYITKTGQAWFGQANDSTFLKPQKINNDTNWKESLCGTTSGNANLFGQRLLIKTTGTLWGLGYTADGWMGTGSATTTFVSPIRQIGSQTDWSTLRGGDKHVLALKTGGAIWSWGNNTYGQVGDNTAVNRSSPVQVGALTTWTKIACGGNHSLALKSDGTMWSWGYNGYGQLGHGNSTNRSSPIQIGALTTWASVFACGNFSFAIKTDGTLWAWGQNFQGYYEWAFYAACLGVGDNTNRNSPVQVGTATDWSNAIVFGDSQGSMKAIKSDGTLWAWGSNYACNILTEPDPSFNYSFNLIGSDTWTKVKCVSAVQTYSTRGSGVMARKSNGTLWRWGGSGTAYGFAGPDGNNRPSDWRSSPVQVTTGSKWTDNFDVSNMNYTVAIDSDGKLWQIGPYSTLIRMTTGSNWASVTLGNDDGVPNTIGGLYITTTGQLWGSGLNNYGQLGNNSTTYVTFASPVRIGTGTTWTRVATKYFSTYAVKSDGTLWAWGRNNIGQLGTSNLIDRSSPVQVGTDTNWSNVFACDGFPGTTSAFAIKTNGTLWAWGSNTWGQLGLLDNTNRSSPTQVGTATNWSKVTGNWATFALRTDGTVWSLGGYPSFTYNFNNRTNPASRGVGGVQRNSPIQVGSLSNITDISYGTTVAIALGT